MSTVWIIALTAVVVVLLAVVFFVAGPGRRGGGGRGLKKRFGPECDRVVAHHDGDKKAAERELDARVKRHGSLELRPLTPETREQYVVRWAALQEQFVDSPQHAVAEADRLLARLAADRGFPADERYDEQVAALSVHHADKVQGYRRVHQAANTDSSTEQMREAMLDARELFETLVTAKPVDSGRHRPQHAEARRGRPHAPWRHHHPRGSGA